MSQNNTFQPLYPWAYEMQGAKKMIFFLVDQWKIDLMPEISKNKGKEAYQRAIIDWLMKDLSNIEKFLSGAEIKFVNHQQDNKGKVISCEVVCNG